MYLLAFDHRQSLERKLDTHPDGPSHTEVTLLRDAKALVFEGALLARQQLADPNSMGVLVDEQYGAAVIPRAREAGMTVAVPIERSGRAELELLHGEGLGEQLARTDPDFAKVLVRYNPEGSCHVNERQRQLLSRVSRVVQDQGRRLLLELLVPPEPAQLESVGGVAGRYDRELRPQLMVEAIRQIQEADVAVDTWKIEGLDRRESCELVAQQARRGASRPADCVALGRGEDEGRVTHWLEQAAPVEGFVGFAIGRSIWWDPLRRYLAADIERDHAAHAIAAKYLHYVSVYQRSSQA